MTPQFLSYNGYDFNPSTETTGLTVKPKYDSSGRSVAYNVFTFKFKTHLKANPDTGGSIAREAEQARQALSKPAGEFRYAGRGVCDVWVNRPGGGGARDVDYGPKPQVVSFAHWGGDTAAEVEWTIEVSAPDCDDAVYQFQVMEYATAVAFSRGDDGRSVREVTGHLTIPATRLRAGDARVLDSADAYRDRVCPPLTEGYRRRYQPFRLNEARTRLDFAYSDEEMPANIPPPGCVAATASHTLSSSGGGIVTWRAQVDAEYTLEKRADPDSAVRAFFTLLKDRVGKTQRYAAIKGKLVDPKVVVPAALVFREPEIYGTRKVGISFGYTFACDQASILAASGMWWPVPGSDWKQWSASLEKGVLSPRGAADIKFDVNSDKMIDLCKPGMPAELVGSVPPLPAGSASFSGADLRTYRSDITRQLATTYVDAAFPKPPESDSWIYYENELWVETESGSVALRFLPTEALKAADDLLGSVDDLAGKAVDALDKATGFLRKAVGTAGTLQTTSPPSAAVQRRVRGLCYIYLIGKAARYGYKVPIPRLVTVAGNEAVPANRLDRGEGYGQGISSSAGSTPIFKARWKLRYVLPETPAELPVPPNPFFGSR